MSAATDLLARGVSEILMNTSIGGDLVTFRGVSVAAHIDLSGGDGTQIPGPAINGSGHTGSILLPTSVTPRPKKGEVITTATHDLRIESVQHMGGWYRCSGSLSQAS